MLAYRGKKKQLVNILSFTETGAVKQYEPYDQPENRFMPLIIDGKNIENFEIVKNKQISLFDVERVKQNELWRKA